MSNTTDPLANVKVSAEEAGLSPELPPELPPTPAPAPVQPAAATPSAAEGPPTAKRSRGSKEASGGPAAKGALASPEPSLPSPGAAPAPVPVYEVLEKGTYHDGAKQVRLAKGKRVSLATHSEAALRAMADCGIKLKQV